MGSFGDGASCMRRPLTFDPAVPGLNRVER